MLTRLMCHIAYARFYALGGYPKMLSGEKRGCRGWLTPIHNG